MKKQITTLIVLAALAAAWPVAAQDNPPPAPEPQQIQPPADQAAAQRPINLNDMRHHIYVMEGALARAVDFGAKQLNREAANAMPGFFMLQGEATARGVLLDGYGVFFDVRVPTMQQSMVWSMQQLMNQNAASNQLTIEELQRSKQGVTDARTIAVIDNAIDRLQRVSGGVVAPRTQPATAEAVKGQVVAESIPMGPAGQTGVRDGRPTAPAAMADNMLVKDPGRAYTEAVTRALVDAMIDYSTPMAIPADQWLTVAARDDEGRDSLAPQDPLEEVVTMIYRIKGSDLQQYRAGKIDRDEVRKRVQISQF
jgi:hypothetical protein